MLVTGDRRSQRRIRRAVAELDPESRLRLRRLLSSARFVVLPTSAAISQVEARLAPGSIPISVACAHELGIDQTIAVAEVLAMKGHDVSLHLAARQIRSNRHLDEILLRLARRAIGRVLVVRGRGASAGLFDSAGAFLAALTGREDAPADIGTAAEVGAGRDRDAEAGRLLERAVHATHVSVQTIPSIPRLLGWVAEMRIRRLGLPIEIGVPGVVRFEELGKGVPGFAAALPPGRQRPDWFDPTDLVAAVARDQTLDQLDVHGLRVETLNHLDATAAWRQQVYDLASISKAG